MVYEIWDANGSAQDEARTAWEAATQVVEWATDDLHDCGEWNEDETGWVAVEIGRPVARTRDVTDSDEDEWARERGYDCLVEEVVFHQVAAAVPVDVMRRALALAEQHDAVLAAELRASLVSP